MLQIVRARYLILLLPLLALAAVGRESPSAFASHTTPPAPPAEHQALYNELSTSLSAYEAQIDSEWDEGVGEGRLAAGLATANGNKTVGLLNATNWTRTIEMLDAFEAMGVEVVKLDIQYPCSRLSSTHTSRPTIHPSSRTTRSLSTTGWARTTVSTTRWWTNSALAE